MDARVKNTTEHQRIERLWVAKSVIGMSGQRGMEALLALRTRRAA